jgi:hypothetical protein
MLSPVDMILSFGGQMKLSAEDKAKDPQSNRQNNKPILTADSSVLFRDGFLKGQDKSSMAHSKATRQASKGGKTSF